MDKKLQTSVNVNGSIKASDAALWVKPVTLGDFADDEFKQMFIFYVINNPCENTSARRIDFVEYGWDKGLWSRKNLKQYLFGIAKLNEETTMCITDGIEKMKEACEKTSLGEDFYKKIDTERIAVFMGDDNQFTCILRHIRNVFAHGRFAIHKCENETDSIFVMEDFGRGRKVSARMILKKSTLLTWMRTLQAGKCPEAVEEKAEE